MKRNFPLSTLGVPDAVTCDSENTGRRSFGVPALMSRQAFIYAANRENFTRPVLENSRRGLVLVDFWAPWVAPSLRQRELLVALAVFNNLEKDDPRVKQYRTEFFRPAY